MQDLMGFMESLVPAQIAVLGDFMLDRYLYGNCERVSQEAPVPVLRVVRREQRCGGAASVAADMLALAARVSCIGVVGQDEAGDQVLGQLTALGAETSGMIKLPGRPTTTKDRLVGLAQHRHQQQMMRVDAEECSPLSDKALSSLRAALRGELTRCGVLALEDYDKGTFTDEATPVMIADARAAGVPVVVDPAKIDDYGRYRGATLLTPNRQEAEVASGIEIVDDASLERAAKQIILAAQAEGVVITLDKQGAYLKVAGAPGKILSTRVRDVYDVTGAGDMVLAMLCVALGGKADWETAVALANVAGGLEVERFGVVPVTREEVLVELAEQKRQQHGKVVTIEELLTVLERLRAAGRKIVWTNGCFDILHAGHTHYLNFARRQGDVLIVGVNSDASVRRNKGPTRPIVDQDDRARVLAALECVDYVVVFEDDTPIEMIRTIGPDVLVKGADWTGAVVGQDIVEAAGGKVVLAEMQPGKSTTDVIDKIVKVFGNGNASNPSDHSPAN